MKDQTLIIYILSTTVSLYGVILFGWWWIKVKKVSAMYMYITFLFISDFILMIINAFTRYQRNIESEFYMNIFEQWWWPARLYLHLAVILAIVIHMTLRAKKNFKNV